MTIFSYQALSGSLQRLRRSATPAPAPAPAARFAGDPGQGNTFSGSTVYTGTAGISDGQAWMNQHAGFGHLLTRRYYTNSFWTRSDISGDQGAGNIPFPSLKMGATTSNASSIIGGSMDSTITAEAQWVAGQGYPIMACFYHEPEDNWSSDTDAANFRAIFRHIVGIFKSNGATNVNWMTIWMAPYTFQSGGESKRGPWWKWDADWKGTISGTNGRTTAADFYIGSQQVCNMFGFDQYVPQIGTTGYHEFSKDLDTTLNRMSADGKTLLPWVIPEMGTQAVTSTTSPLPSDGWTGYYTRAFQYMSANNGVGYVAYNTDGNNFLNGSDAANRLSGYIAGVKANSSSVITKRPY